MNNDSIYLRGDAARLDFLGSSLGQLCGNQIRDR